MATAMVVGSWPAVTRVDHGLKCGALASMVWFPGSTGTATPHSARPTSTPSRVTVIPSVGAATVTLMRGKVGNRLSAWRWAAATMSCFPAACAAEAPSRYVAQAVAGRSVFS